MKPKLNDFINEIKPYVPGKAIDEVKRELGLSRIVKLASNESPYPPFPEALKAIDEAKIEVNRYPDSNCYELKNAIAEFYSVEREMVFIGNGSDEIMKLLAQVILSPGEEAVIPSPSFIFYPIATLIAQGRPITVPLDERLKIDLNQVLSKVSEKTKLIFLANPNNPTSTIFKGGEFQKFLNSLPRNIVVIVDEAYAEFVTDKDYKTALDFLSSFENLVILRTFSKIYGLAGLRIGYGIMSPYLVEALNKIREPFNVNSLAQKAALASLKAQDRVSERRSENAKNREYLSRELQRRSCEVAPSQANFLFVKFKVEGRKIFEKLLRKGIVVRTGDIFGKGFENYLRISIGSKEEIKFFLNTLNEIGVV
jgi:histidinol-phosphate aminotransferase